MRSLINILAIVFIILGLVSLGYKGFSYTKSEQVAQIGDVKVTADQEKQIIIPPGAGIAAVVAGIVLLVVGRKK